MTRKQTISRLMLAAGAALALSAAGLAMAGAPEAAVETSRTLMTFNDNGNIVRVEGDGTTATIKLNGEQVAQKPLDGSWTSYDVVGPDGSVIATLTNTNGALSISSPGTQIDPRELAARGEAMRMAELAELRALGSAAVPPRVMLGVTLGMPDRVTAEQLGFDASKATVLTSVYPELPAAAAGLQSGDIIVGVNGSANADQQSIRELLRSKGAGDTIAFDVISKGERKTVEVKLEAFDPSRMSAGSGVATFNWDGHFPGAQGQGGRLFQLGEFDKRMDELNAKLKSLTAELSARASRMRSSAAKDAEVIGQQMAELADQMSVLADQIAEETQRRIPLMMEGVGRAIVTLRDLDGRVNTFFAPPAPPPAPSTPGQSSVPAAPPAPAAANDDIRALIAEMRATNEANAQRMREMEAVIRQLQEQSKLAKPQ